MLGGSTRGSLKREGSGQPPRRLAEEAGKPGSGLPCPCIQSGPGGSENTTDWLEEVLPFKELP